MTTSTAMTFDDLIERLRTLGFACAADRFGEDGDRVIVAKLQATLGNRIGGAAGTFSIEDEHGMVTCHEIDEPCPEIWRRDGGYDFTVVGGVPSSPGAYRKEMATAEEVYEEVLHYFFDADSRMNLEPGFVAGPGRPTGA